LASLGVPDLERSTGWTPRSGRTANGDAPERLTDLSGRSWRDALKRTVKAFKADKLTDWAAARTYYGVLAIFPALLVVVSVLGLIGDSVT
jgi:membrane protein